VRLNRGEVGDMEQARGTTVKLVPVDKDESKKGCEYIGEPGSDENRGKGAKVFQKSSFISSFSL
jgi:hypothetical protein